jgi:hypothetical protein
MTEFDEVQQTIDHVQRVLEDLMVRGLRSAGPGEMTTLANLTQELSRVGAHHLAARLEALGAAITRDDGSASGVLLHAQAGLRVFERILTLEVAHQQMTALLPCDEEADEPA